MAPVAIKIVVDGKLVKQGLQDLAEEIPEIGTFQIYQAVLRSRTRMRKKVAPPTYPVKWTSVKQQRKVLILLRYTLKQMPYRRTDTFRNNFVIEKLKLGYTLANATEGAAYLIGDEEGNNQIRMARDRYLVMRHVIDEEMQKLPSAVVKHIQIVAAQKGFKSGNG